jgi:ribonucleoside-diphosphate reductase alpha chain
MLDRSRAALDGAAVAALADLSEADAGTDPGGGSVTAAQLATPPPRDPFDAVEWSRRDAVIRGRGGAEVFRQDAVEAPAGWSQTAVDVVASKYFRGTLGTPARERSVRQLLGRVVGTIAAWAEADGLIAPGGAAEVFRYELATLLLRQGASFNSPVWFNVGVETAPQCSACFINSVADSLEAILGLARTEGMLFKYGSGSGSNLSSLRASFEPLSNGGTASGPLSFMRGLDAFAGAIKSGGKTRRAARMVILDDWHPDVLAFVRAKEIEEAKARALIAAGYAAGFDVAGGAYDSVAFQNANHSVRLSDDFLRAVEADGPWTTRRVADGSAATTSPARELFAAIAEAAWACGDPGVQYESTIQRWHTCPESGRIRASNPCSEFMFLDDSACNLASLNLLRFWTPAAGFDAASFTAACALLVTAQEALVDRARYPTPVIAERTHDFRPLGLGFANLGGLLMAAGLPYDSPAGRALAGAVAGLMTGAAYGHSARLAAKLGPFAGYAANREAMTAVVAAHREAAAALPAELLPPGLHEAVLAVWDEALALGAAHGFRNAQVTCLAPTGTIAFMMDCDTTGVEPELALVKHKQLVGGGDLRLVNGTVALALTSLGYDEPAAAAILDWLEEHGTVEGAPGLAAEHLAVFDCALTSGPGRRAIGPRGHLQMLSALQPLISGAISKTINLPHDATVEAIEEVLLDGWRLGLKALTVYRDGCKQSQPVTRKGQPQAGAGSAVVSGPAAGQPANGAATAAADVGVTAAAGTRPPRRRLPDERQSLTHKFSIQGHEGYVTVGLYEDGQPGEIFLVMAKEGSTISGLMDGLATAISIALQYGVPLAALVEKFSHTRFEPSGMTRNPEIPFARSITDYLFRWLGSRFLPPEQRQGLGLVDRSGQGGTKGEAAAGGAASTANGHRPADTGAVASAEDAGGLTAAGIAAVQSDAPACHVCGMLMTRSGTCYRCGNCGATSGCG